MTLESLVADAEVIAYSRLWRNDLDKDLEELGRSTVETPHIAGIPVGWDLERDTVRVVEWPNLLGILEPFGPSDIVRWDPFVAPSPETDRVITPQGVPTRTNTKSASHRLAWVFRRLEQGVGVSRAIADRGAVGILLTPGVASDDIAQVNEHFPGTTRSVRKDLGEFPGGLEVIATEGLCDDTEGYADALTAAILKGAAT